MRILIYARVSSKHQDVDQQVQYMKEWAKKLNYVVIWTIKDKESATIPLFNRKQFQKLIKTIDGTAEEKERYNFLDKCDAVVIYKVDRLSRYWYDENEIEKAFVDSRINLISSSEPIDMKTQDGLFLFRLYFSMACKETEVMKERQKIGIARALKEGKYKGGKVGRSWGKKNDK
jgi:DNA invertase Pin-like site-specific DNA recombinase